MTVGAMIAAGAAATRARARTVAAVFAVELGVSVVFLLAAGFALTGVYGNRPLFARGVDGDAVALYLALGAHLPMVKALFWTGVALLVAWKLFSLWLGAGLLGALSGRPFLETAAARFGGFVRLSLWSLLFYAAIVLVALLGLDRVGLRLEDLAGWDTITGRPLAGLAPALVLLLVTGAAVDYGRAHLVLDGGGAARALARGLVTALRRPARLLHLVAYLVSWGALGAIYLAFTIGRGFPGAGGLAVLLLLRQLTAAGRFAARTIASGGQIASLRP